MSSPTAAAPVKKVPIHLQVSFIVLTTYFASLSPILKALWSNNDHVSDDLLWIVKVNKNNAGRERKVSVEETEDARLIM